MPTHDPQPSHPPSSSAAHGSNHIIENPDNGFEVSRYREFRFQDGLIEFARSRAMLFDTTAYRQLVTILNRFVPDQTRTILFQTGYHNIHQFVDTYLSGRYGTRDDFIFVLETLRKIGYGRISLRDYSIEEGRCVIVVRDCFESNAIGHSPTPTDHLLRGVFAALMEMIAGKRVVCEETKCAAKGDAYCQFETMSYSA